MTDGGAPAPGHDLQQVRTVDREQQRTPPELSKANTAHVLDEEDDPTSPRQMGTPNPWSRRPTSLDLDDYFKGPRDIAKHSKWPLFMQMHGSILPKMLLPLFVVACWATLITLLTKLLPWVDLGISSILITITGFVVGLGLSFRSSTAYERYAEGRKYWGQLTVTCQSLARTYWIHATEREGQEKQDVLAKLTALNLLIAFAVSLKHKLRFEPYAYHEDLKELIEHLDTYAMEATHDETFEAPKRKNIFKIVGESLGVSFAQSNPRKLMKKAKKPLGNLPLEILCYLTAYTDELSDNGQLPYGMQSTIAYNGLTALNDVLVNCERILNTPLPIAYAIAIQQITWLYIFLLPFQLLKELDWVTIPATIAASAIILSILFIGREVENPFGDDVNDLPLDLFCAQIVEDMETIASRPKRSARSWIESSKNKVLYPHSRKTHPYWMNHSKDMLREELSKRPGESFKRNAAADPEMKHITKQSLEKQDV